MQKRRETVSRSLINPTPLPIGEKETHQAMGENKQKQNNKKHNRASARGSPSPPLPPPHHPHPLPLTLGKGGFTHSASTLRPKAFFPPFSRTTYLPPFVAFRVRQLAPLWQGRASCLS